MLVLVGSANTCGEEEAIHPDAGSVCVRDPQSGELPADCVYASTEGSCWTRGVLSAVSFAVGALTSVVSGFIGMRIAVFANARTALECQDHGVQGSGWLVVSVRPSELVVSWDFRFRSRTSGPVLLDSCLQRGVALRRRQARVRSSVRSDCGIWSRRFPIAMFGRVVEVSTRKLQMWVQILSVRSITK